MKLKTFRALVRLADMEGHVSVLVILVWKMNSSEKFWLIQKLSGFQRKRRNFAEIVNPTKLILYECSVGNQ